MNSLEKVFVYVPTALCNTFRDYHMPGGSHYDSQTDKYANKIVFLQDTNSIYTHGELYGGGGQSDPWQEYEETSGE